MFSVPPSACGPLYALVSGCGSGYECDRYLNVPSPAFPYFSSHIVEETDVCEVIRRIAVSESTVIVLTTFLASARGVLGSPWGIDARIRNQSARGVPISLLAGEVRLVDGEAFLKLFHNSALDETHALLASRRAQKIEWY